MVSPVISPGLCAIGFKCNSRRGGLIGLIPQHYQNCFHNTDQIIAQQGPLTAWYTQLSPPGGFHIYLLRGEMVEICRLYKTGPYTAHLKASELKIYIYIQEYTEWLMCWSVVCQNCISDCIGQSEKWINQEPKTQPRTRTGLDPGFIWSTDPESV